MHERKLVLKSKFSKLHGLLCIRGHLIVNNKFRNLWLKNLDTF